MEYLFRFEKPREHQKQMIEDIHLALSAKKSILLNAPTGIGKTDASLSTALTFAKDKNLDIFFLTPKISQHKIVVDSLKGIRDRFKLDMKYIDIVGKQNLCINEKINILPKELFYSACNKAVKGGKCFYYTNAKNTEEFDSKIHDNALLGHSKLFNESANQGLCAYEVSAKLSKTAKVIIADYAHMLNPTTRSAFLRKMSHNLEDSILIWDEAHNIMEIASSYLSDSISIKGIARADSELKSIGRSMDLSYLSFKIKDLSENMAPKLKESFVKRESLGNQINEGIGSITEELDKHALEYLEKSGSKRSAILHISNFLKKWENEDNSVVRIISKENNNIRLGLSCLYPEKVIDLLNESYANIFMSATLSPLKMYAEMFGVEEKYSKNYLSPFPKSNKMVFVDDKSTTSYSKRSDSTYEEIAKNIEEVVKLIPGNVAVFFPSFSVLKNIYKYMKEKDSIMVQEEGIKSIGIERLMTRLNNTNDNILFGVMGGSLSEGIDYKNNSIKGLIIVGIPLAVPTLEVNARIEYLNRKFNGKGNDYAYRIPAMMRVIQAAGRAIRNENDKAVIVFMDSRYKWKTYNSMITNTFDVTDIRNIKELIRWFWNNNI